MILDIRRLGLSVAAVKALFFALHYLGGTGSVSSKLCPMAYLGQGCMSGTAGQFVMGDFLTGLVLASLWGYVCGALIAVVYNRLGR